VWDAVAPADEEAGDGDGVGDVEEDDACCDHTASPRISGAVRDLAHEVERLSVIM